jgi:hypothetical protein
LKWIDAVILNCSFDTRVSGHNPYSDASKDEGGGGGEQTITHLGLLFVKVHWPLMR